MEAVLVNSKEIQQYVLKHVQNIEADDIDYLASRLDDVLHHKVNGSCSEVVHRESTEWLHWAEHCKHLKIHRYTVPDGVLQFPGVKSADLIDVKVFCKHGPDDAIYDSHPAIREKVARGNCLMEIHTGDSSILSCVVYGLKKFTGGLGDDDDRDTGDNHVWKKYFTKPIQDTRTVVSTHKANGEAAHMSCQMINNAFLICAGSKNVHLVFTDKEQINLYTGSRFTFAREVGHAIMDMLDAMTHCDRHRLLSFLCHTNFTANFEILQPSHQHVVDLSYLDRAELQFITWTSNSVQHRNHVAILPTHYSIEIARALGIETVSYEIVTFDDIDDKIKKIRQGYGYEGEVLYFLDSSLDVIGLLKKKTIWYIICRAIREKVRGACQRAVKNSDSSSTSRTLHMIDRRLNEIQQWLSLDDHSLQQWKELGKSFCKWCLDKIEDKHHLADVADQFPVTWKTFLEETRTTDKIASMWSETDEI